MKNVVIYTQKMSGYLMMKGFVLIKMFPNENGNGKNVFLFRDTPEIREAMREYSNNK